jgi:hypothetical protein
MSDETARIREGIARYAKQIEGSPLMTGKTQEQREDRVRKAVVDAEKQGRRPPLPPE